MPRESQLTFVHLWGIAVGSAIGGNFVGWNSTLLGGLAGALLGLAISTILYMTLSLCIAEMSAHTLKIGGSHTFVGESPLGRLGAYVCGVAELLKIIPTGSLCVFAVASYLSHSWTNIWGPKMVLEVGVWILTYSVFTLINIVGMEMSINLQVASTVVSIMVLASFYMPSLVAVDLQAYSLSGLEQKGVFFDDLASMWIALPYSLWWYLGIENVPLMAGSMSNPAQVMPKVIIASMATLALVATLTLVLNSSVFPGVVSLADSKAPLLDGFKALTENQYVLHGVSLLISSGLIVSFNCFVLYAGETIAVLANDGILPTCLGVIHPRYGTPHVALAGSSLIGLSLLACAVGTMSGSKAVSVLINVAVVGGLVAYILQFVAYLSRQWASSDSGFRSPLGRPGACLGLGLSVMLLGCEFFHASVEVTDAEGLLMAMSVFGIALLVYWLDPPWVQKNLVRKRALSLEGSAEGPYFMNTDEEEGRADLGHFDPLSSSITSMTTLTPVIASPQRRRPLKGATSNGANRGNTWRKEYCLIGDEGLKTQSSWCDV